MGKMIKEISDSTSKAPEEVLERLRRVVGKRDRPHLSYQQLWDLAGSSPEPMDDASAFIADALSVWGEEHTS